MRWIPVCGWPAYEVSEFGDVRRRGLTRALKTDRYGYRCLALSRNGLKQCFTVHRLVAFAFIGPPPTPLHQIAHIDGNPSNNHRSNLRWATAKENIADRTRHGRQWRGLGSANGCAKLNERDVADIRYLAARGVNQYAIADVYGTTQANVSCIKLRKSWSHM